MKYALRQLTKSPGFTVVALITLALGIGMNSTIFSLINVLVYQMPAFKEPDRLISLYGPTPEDPRANLGLANVRDVIAQNTVFEQVATYNLFTPNLSLPGSPPERAIGFNVSGDFFKVLGVDPLLGRYIAPNETGSSYNIAVVSEKFWKNRLGGRADVIGSTLRVDGRMVTVIGVMPARFKDLGWNEAVIWEPVEWSPAQWADRKGYFWLRVITRLKPGVSLEQAQVQMDTIAKRLTKAYPEANTHTGIHIERLEDYRQNWKEQSVFLIFQGLTLCVLLIACINLAALQLSRTASRTHEHAIRIALGASRGQLIRQLLSECVLLSLAGGTLGLVVALWGNTLLGKGMNLPIDIDYRVVGVTLLVSLATGVGFGLTPALNASRTDVNRVLKQGSRAATGDRSKHRLRNLLVVGELALALGVLSAAGFFVRGTQQYIRPPAHPGWNYENLLIGSFVLPYASYTNDEQSKAGIERICLSLSRLPGVDHVAVSDTIPVFGFPEGSHLAIEGQPPAPKDKSSFFQSDSISLDYFSTLGMELLAGRNFTTADRANSKHVVIINARMAQKFWPHGNAIGHRIRAMDEGTPNWQEIVGIVGDIRSPGLPEADQMPFQTYQPLAQARDPHWLDLAVHGNRPPETMIDSVRRAVANVDPDLALSELKTVAATLKDSRKSMFSICGILIFAALLGLLLSLIGIYAVIANLVVQRTKELGIRIALGASPKRVASLLLKNGLRLAGYGTGIGLLLAFSAARVLSRMVPYLQGEDPYLTLELAGLLVLATLLASWLPARRATRVNPADALRAE